MQYATKKSAGTDGISNYILKNISKSILTRLCILINKSMEHGHIPDILKAAKILPLYENKENLLTNYRPVSVLLSISKILEKVVYKRVCTFMSSNNRLYQKQYGFRKQCSTIDAVMDFVKDTLLAYDDHEFTAAVFLDFCKAFDTIHYSNLFRKLEHNGIHELSR